MIEAFKQGMGECLKLSGQGEGTTYLSSVVVSFGRKCLYSPLTLMGAAEPEKPRQQLSSESDVDMAGLGDLCMPLWGTELAELWKIVSPCISGSASRAAPARVRRAS